MTEVLPDKCINCGTEFTADYCSICGQRRKVERLTIRSAWMDFQRMFFGLDNKFFRTFKAAWVNPGEVARSSIDGNRIKYVGPVSYFFLMLTILVLFVTTFEVDWTVFMAESLGAFEAESVGQKNFQESMMENIFANYRTFQFFIIPFIALSAKMFFRKKGFNFLEHMVLVFYTQAQMISVTILNMVFFLTIDKTFLLASGIIPFFFYGYACYTFYPSKYKLGRFIKGMFTQLVGMILFLIAFMLLMLVGLFIYAKINPEYFEQFKKPVQSYESFNVLTGLDFAALIV